MHGIPHAIKDLAYARGLKTSEGSPIIAGTLSKKDDLFVSRIRESGAIFIGKTNTPEFGLGSQTYNKVFGVTRNAYDPSLTAGGSSGGAASGLATHMLPVADGSDMMGSLRNPAAFNNVIGFRPSQGRVPVFYGYYPNTDTFYQQLSTDGPMGRNIEDMTRLLLTMAGPDKRVPLSLKDEMPAYEKMISADLSNTKIGWLGNYNGYLPMEDGVLGLCEKALSDLENTGLIIENCHPNFEMENLWQTWLVLRFWSNQWIKPFYEKNILPWLINFTCNSGPINYQRKKIIPDARGMVLEIGIGPGSNLKHYDNQKVTSLIGIDPSSELNTIAKKRAEKNNLDIKFLIESASNLSVESNSIDTVVSTYALCSIPVSYTHLTLPTKA